ncbi:MAG: LysM peptidoglycan-binding domain-containing protein, partial [Chloroflexi bacterium]|nr:LysM peptidoglycan-binding domain-containing protein [Chloroflexota bacterium]
MFKLVMQIAFYSQLVSILLHSHDIRFSGIISIIMRKVFLVVTLIGMLFVLGVDVAPASAQAGNAYDLIAAVNQFRATQRLPALQISGALMASAQAHSDYQAAIRTVTHVGAGGTGAKDRAIAAGFGGGAQFFISENIAGGLYLSVNTAVYTYWQDALHLSTMLNPDAQYVGAGTAFVGDYVYYTLDVGNVVGVPTPGVNVTPIVGGPTVVAYAPFVVSTPRGDGAIIHVVGYGQTLTGIANTYEVEVAELLTLNGLTTDSVIYPGEEIIIRAGSTFTTTVSPTNSAPAGTPSTTITQHRQSPTPRASFTPRPTSTLTPTVTPIPISAERERLVVGVVLMSLAVLLAVIVSGFLK